MSRLYYFFLMIFVFLSPFIPDEKISRHKLLFMESAILISWQVWVWQIVKTAKLNWGKIFPSLPILAYGIVTLIFYFLASKKVVAQTELERMSACLGIFWIASLGIQREQIKKLIFVWLCSASLIALYGVSQHYGGFGPVIVPKIDRIYATFGNPIFFAAFLVISIPFFFVGLDWAKNFFARVAILSGLGISLLALYFTASRAAWLGFFASLILFVFLSEIPRRSKLLFLILILEIGVVSVFYTWEKIWLRPQAHFYIWRDSLRMWLTHPLLGTGLGSFHTLFPGYASETLKKIYPSSQFIVNDAHSEFIQTLAETGLIGLAMVIWIIYSFYYTGIKILKKYFAPREKLFVLAGLASGTGILVQNIFSVDMRFIVSAIYFYFVFGLIVAYGPREKTIALPRSKSFKFYFLTISLTLGVLFSRHIYTNFSLPRRLAKAPDFFRERVENSPQVIQEVEELIKVNPNDALLYDKLGWLYSKERNWPPAIANFQKALQLNPSRYGAFNNLGNIYFTMGDRAKAKENYLKSLALNSNQVDAHFNLGYAYFMEGQIEKATEEFRQVLKLNPAHAQARVLLKKMVE